MKNEVIKHIAGSDNTVVARSGVRYKLVSAKSVDIKFIPKIFKQGEDLIAKYQDGSQVTLKGFYSDTLSDSLLESESLDVNEAPQIFYSDENVGFLNAFTEAMSRLGDIPALTWAGVAASTVAGGLLIKSVIKKGGNNSSVDSSSDHPLQPDNISKPDDVVQPDNNSKPENPSQPDNASQPANASQPDISEKPEVTDPSEITVPEFKIPNYASLSAALGYNSIPAAPPVNDLLRGVAELRLPGVSRKVWYAESKDEHAYSLINTRFGDVIGLAQYNNSRIATLDRDLLKAGLSSDPQSGGFGRVFFNILSWLADVNRIPGTNHELNVFMIENGSGPNSSGASDGFFKINTQHKINIEALHTPGEMAPNKWNASTIYTRNMIIDALSKDGAWLRTYDVVIVRTDVSQDVLDTLKEWMDATNGSVLFEFNCAQPVYQQAVEPSQAVLDFLLDTGLEMTKKNGITAGDYTPVSPVQSAIDNIKDLPLITGDYSFSFRDAKLTFTPENLAFNDMLASRAGVFSVRLNGRDDSHDIDLRYINIPAVQDGNELASFIELAINNACTGDADVTVRLVNNKLILNDPEGRVVETFVLGSKAKNIPVILSGNGYTDTQGVEGSTSTIFRTSFQPNNYNKLNHITLRLKSIDGNSDINLVDGVFNVNNIDTLQTQLQQIINDKNILVTFDSVTNEIVITDRAGRVFEEVIFQNGRTWDQLLKMNGESITDDQGHSVAILGGITGHINALDPNGAPVTFRIIDQGNFGSVELDEQSGRWIYTPRNDGSYHGFDQFHVEAVNQNGEVSSPILVEISSQNQAALALPGIKEYRVSDPEYIEPSATFNPVPADFVLNDVFIAQIHVQRPDDPYLQLVQNRWALIKVNASSLSGAAAPDFEAVVKDGQGNELGRVRLTGPANLPVSLDLPGKDNLATDTGHTNADSYTAPLKGEWIKPGISITIEAAGAPVDLPGITEAVPGTFNPLVGPDVVIDVRLLNYLRYENNLSEYPGSMLSWAQEVLAKLPVSGLKVYSYPMTTIEDLTWQGEKYTYNVDEPGSDSYSSLKVQGLTAYTTPKWLVELGYNLRDANFTPRAGTLGAQVVYVNGSDMGGAGLGGNSAGGGGPINYLLWHEAFGHGLGLGHANTDPNHPYKDWVAENGQSNAGALGWNWGFDQFTGEFLPNFYYGEYYSPTSLNLSLMVSSSASDRYTQASGYFTKLFSDYETQILANNLAKKLVWVPNAIPGQDIEDAGFAGDGYYKYWDASQNNWVILTRDNYKKFDSSLIEEMMPHKHDVPVYWIVGNITKPDGSSVKPGDEYFSGNDLNITRTIGNLPADYYDVLRGTGYKSSSNYVARVTYSTESGLIIDHILIPGSLTRLSFNVPDKGELVRVDIVEAVNGNADAYRQNNVAYSWVNSTSLANTLFSANGTFAADEPLVLPKYWHGGKVFWSCNTEGVVDRNTGQVDLAKLTGNSAVKAEWIEHGILNTRTFMLKPTEGMLLDNTINTQLPQNDYTWISIGDYPESLFSEAVDIKTATLNNVVSGGKFNESFVVGEQFDHKENQFWVKLLLKDKLGMSYETSPLENWSVVVTNGVMTVKGLIDSTPNITVTAIKIFADDNLTDSVPPSTVTISTNEGVLGFLSTGRVENFTFLYGSDNSETLSATEGSSQSWGIFGGEGNDIITGSKQNDILVGGVGDDIVITGGGNDDLTGGAGHDIFKISWSDVRSYNLIRDFSHKEDIIDISDILEGLSRQLTSDEFKSIKLDSVNQQNKSLLSLSGQKNEETIIYCEIELSNNTLSHDVLYQALDLGQKYRWDVNNGSIIAG